MSWFKGGQPGFGGGQPPQQPQQGGFLGGAAGGPWGGTPIHQPSFGYKAQPGVADDIDFEIKGAEMQFVEIELDPGESCVAEAGAMMFKDSWIDMETIFGDGSHASQTSGFMGKLMGAGKRLLTGESLFTTQFTHKGQGKAASPSRRPIPARSCRCACQSSAARSSARRTASSSAPRASPWASPSRKRS